MAFRNNRGVRKDQTDHYGRLKGSYTLPIASTSSLGGIKVGDNLTIEADGTLNAQGGGGSSYAKKTLYSDGVGIYEEPEMTNSLTFVQVKAILDNANNDVELWNGNYILLPEYSSTETGVTTIYFNGTTELNGNTYMYCIKIDTNDEVTNDEHQLINVTNIGTGLEFVSNKLNVTGGASGLTMDLLWTNSSPSSEFAAQTVSLDLSNYKAIIIYCAFGKSSTTADPYGYLNSIIVPVSSDKTFGLFTTYESFACRPFTVSTTGVVFSDGKKVGTYGSSYTTNNSSSIPYSIYGIK